MESCGNFIFPKIYTVKNKNIKTHIPRNASIFNKPQCCTKSALDKNLNAKASSKNPSMTFVVLSHPPDFGSDFIIFGNIAKRAKGRPRATPKPAIPAVSCQAPPSADNDPARRDPRIGPVQENDTIDKVRAMKKTPKIPPIPSPLLVKVVQVEGKDNS